VLDSIHKVEGPNILLPFFFLILALSDAMMSISLFNACVSYDWSEMSALTIAVSFSTSKS
jgi:hypothetical protein